jgi:hypothetical protein
MQLKLWHDFHNTILKSNMTYIASGSAPLKIKHNIYGIRVSPPLNKKLWVGIYSGQRIVYFLTEVTTASFQFSFRHSLRHFPPYKVCILKIISDKLRNNVRTDPTKQVTVRITQHRHARVTIAAVENQQILNIPSVNLKLSTSWIF